MNAYKAILNRQALNQLSKPVDNPEFHLMVGCAEELSSQPIMKFADFMPEQVASVLPNIEGMTYEEVQSNLASGKLTIDDFFQNVYPLGEPIAEV